MRSQQRAALLVVAALAACSPDARREAPRAADSTPSPPAAVPVNPAAALADLPASARPVPTQAPSAADSVRGIVERVGSDPGSVFTVRAPDGSRCALQMSPSAAVEGLEVAFWGTRRGAAARAPGVSCTLTVERFAVRAADGIAAVDGTLLMLGNSYALELASGARLALRQVPPALRPMIGARIFWAGPLDRAPAAYGVLDPRR